MAMIYRLTFRQGHAFDFEADRLEDDGRSLELWRGEALVARYQDSDIISCERLDASEVEAGDIYGRRGGCRLYDGEGGMIAAYRDEKAARAAILQEH